MKDIFVLSSLMTLLLNGEVFGIFITKIIGPDPSAHACIGDRVFFICSATNTSSKLLSLSSNDFGGVAVVFFLNDSLPVRTPGHYYTVTLLSSSPLTARAEATVTLALNGSEVRCAEGATFKLIGKGHLDIQVPPELPNITILSTGRDWIAVALAQTTNGGAPSVFTATTSGGNRSISVNATNGTAMVNLTGLSECTPTEISVTALNCAGNASDVIQSQLSCPPLLSTEVILLMPSPSPTPHESEHGNNSPTLTTIISVAVTVTILFIVVIAAAATIAARQHYKSKVTLSQDRTDTVLYEDITSMQKSKDGDRVEVVPNEAYQESTIAVKDNVAYSLD